MTMKIITKRDRSTPTRRFRVGGKNHYKVELSIDSDDDTLDNISSVEYVLHPSFRDRIRRSDDKNTKFGTDIWTYGYFPVEAKIVDNDGNETTIVGNVEFK